MFIFGKYVHSLRTCVFKEATFCRIYWIIFYPKISPPGCPGRSGPAPFGLYPLLGDFPPQPPREDRNFFLLSYRECLSFGYSGSYESLGKACNYLPRQQHPNRMELLQQFDSFRQYGELNLKNVVHNDNHSCPAVPFCRTENLWVR